MGVVYEAFDRERREAVALKTLLRFDAASLYRIKQEFRTIADVRHPNLVRLHELTVTESDGAYFTMELVHGTDILTYVRREDVNLPIAVESHVTRASPGRRSDTALMGSVGILANPESFAKVEIQSRTCPADIDRLRAVLRQLVLGVQAIHDAGKLHRDIKPSNVLVSTDGRVVVLDFGVSTELRSTDANVPDADEVVGTATYMAPEQALAEPKTTAADWYSVGVVLYEALVGRPPFAGPSVDVIWMKASINPLRPSDCVGEIPADLDSLCTALLDRDPARRPSGHEILRRLSPTPSSAPVRSDEPANDQRSARALVGRESQLSALRDAFDGSLGGRLVTMGVRGGSGMGKSAVAQHFLDGVVAKGEAIVLRGRVYERESVPYKAIDSVIDAMSRYLMHLDDQGQSIAMPTGIAELAQVFPVLRRIDAIAAVAQADLADPQHVRREAFTALRELLTTVATAAPLVIYIDDAQWGDADSAAVLLELVRPPDAPPLLIVMTYRDNEAANSPFLQEVFARWPAGAELRDIHVGPLSIEEGTRLALSMLPGHPDRPGSAQMAVAQAVAHEAAGSPFLIQELARSNAGVAETAEGATLSMLTLDQVVAQRLAQLPEGARELLEIVALAGRPLAVSVVAMAANMVDGIDDAIGTSRARRLLLTGLRDGRDVVETSHDRFRETIVGQLGEQTRKRHHGRLAQALEGAPGSDPEAVAVHWAAAGDSERAARIAEGAAREAAAKLAFDHAARLYRLALLHAPASKSAAEVRSLKARIAEMLQFDGRYDESARAYIDAAEGAPADERVEFRRAAAEQLLSAGRMDEGQEMLRQVLRALGMRVPGSALAAVFWLLVHRIWLAVVGLHYQEREPDAVSREDRVRIDALFTVVNGLSVVDVILGACMQTRHLIEALKKGDRYQIVRATGLEAGHMAASGAREIGKEFALVEISMNVADRDGRPEALAYASAARGIGLWNRGRWKEAQALLNRAVSLFSRGSGGFAMTHIFDVYVYYFLGAFRETNRKMARLLKEADGRRDLFTAVNVRTAAGIWLSLIADEPDQARRDMRHALAQWSYQGFSLQHWQDMVWGAEIDLYAGDGERAYDHMVQRHKRLKGSFLLHAGFIRAATFYMRGRAAIASITQRRDLAPGRIAEARRMARRLAQENEAWTGALASFLRSMAHNAAGEKVAATKAMRMGLEQALQSNTMVYAEPARYRLGELIGGPEGAKLMEQAAAAMTAEGVKNPARWVACQFPGVYAEN